MEAIVLAPLVTRASFVCKRRLNSHRNQGFSIKTSAGGDHRENSLTLSLREYTRGRYPSEAVPWYLKSQEDFYPIDN